MTPSQEPVFLDTNVLVYALDTGQPRKQAIARQILATQWSMVSAQVLGEFYVVTTRKLAVPLAPADAATVVRRWPAARVVAVTASLVAAAVETAQQHQLSYWDALIVEAARAAGCSRLLTEDLADGAVLRGVQIENPFSTTAP
jgi:predicted nucleic acid-binding protein